MYETNIIFKHCFYIWGMKEKSSFIHVLKSNSYAYEKNILYEKNLKILIIF